jgi:hypothetical protein
MNAEQIKDLQKQGFLILRNVFDSDEIDMVHDIVARYHEKWKVRNKTFYEEQAINSAYLTHRSYMPEQDRIALFNFISNAKLLNIVQDVIPEPCFFNTQLFFDPYNEDQANYWHRDIQYGLTETEQKALLHSSEIMPHFRIPMRDEDGLELIPCTHLRWDTEAEYKVRTESNGAHCSDNLPGSAIMSLRRGDLLIFSGMMLHRGLYGGNRMALDLLYADASSKYLRDSDPSCLPESKLLEKLQAPIIFRRSLAAIARLKSTQRLSQQS